MQARFVCLPGNLPTAARQPLGIPQSATALAVALDKCGTLWVPGLGKDDADLEAFHRVLDVCFPLLRSP